MTFLPQSNNRSSLPPSLLAILFIGLVLRIWGIQFGLPDLYHADEPIVVNHALAYGTGDFNPHFFKIPPLVSYFLFLVYGLYYVLARTAGWIHGTNEFASLFFSHPASFYLLARLVFGALLGTAAVFLLFRLAERIYSRQTGLLASWFFATAFLAVRDAHYIYADIPLLFVLVALFFILLKIAERGGNKDYLCFGIWLGIAVATKYNGVFILAPFLAAHFLRRGFKLSSFFDFKPASSALVSILVFALLNPFGALDPRSFFRELFGQGRAEGWVGLTHHLTYSLAGGLGIPLLALSCLGFFGLRDAPKKEPWLLASFVAVYYLVLCFFSQHYDRYVLPLLPFLCIFAGAALVRFKKQLKISESALWLIAVLIVSPSLAKVYLSDQLFMRKDIRTVAREWVESSVPEGTKIALDVPFFMPRLKPSLEQMAEKKKEALSENPADRAKAKRIDWMTEAIKKNQRSNYELYFLSKEEDQTGFLFARPKVPYDISQLKRMGIQYVVVTKINQEREAQFFEQLQGNADLVARFTPYRNPHRKWAIDPEPLTGGPFLWSELVARERNGQIIEVYKLN